ncbi:hypothetical protein [Clostridium polynesiense]|uniref:hypothetical protein n=1 Tax=Clostridium polynesiense TaxID=1325933 RepID=UPI00058E4C18|nr:hypothetical protein [Clostridium polynesiense]
MAFDLLWAIVILFLIIYFAVRLALNPKIKADKQNTLSLLKFQNIITIDEYNKISKALKDKAFRRLKEEKYKKSLEFLNEIKEFFSEEELNIKKQLLMERYNIR